MIWFLIWGVYAVVIFLHLSNIILQKHEKTGTVQHPKDCQNIQQLELLFYCYGRLPSTVVMKPV